MSEPAVLHATLERQAVRTAHAESYYNVSRSLWWYWGLVALAFVLSVEVGMDASFLLVQHVEPWLMAMAGPFFSVVIPLVLFMGLLWWISNRWQQRQYDPYEELYRENGGPTEVDATYAVTDEGLSLSTERGEWLARWPSILKVDSTTGGWLVLADLGGFLLPKAAFADGEAERAFMAALCARLPEAAKVHSPAAMAIAGSEA